MSNYPLFLYEKKQCIASVKIHHSPAVRHYFHDSSGHRRYFNHFSDIAKLQFGTKLFTRVTGNNFIHLKWFGPSQKKPPLKNLRQSQLLLLVLPKLPLVFAFRVSDDSGDGRNSLIPSVFKCLSSVSQQNGNLSVTD